MSDPPNRLLRHQLEFLPPLHNDHPAPVLQDVDVNRRSRQEMIDMDMLFLPISAGATDRLRHRGLVIVLGRCEQGGKENDVVGTLDVPNYRKVSQSMVSKIVKKTSFSIH
jgi:hypothetical protein